MVPWFVAVACLERSDPALEAEREEPPLLAVVPEHVPAPTDGPDAVFYGDTTLDFALELDAAAVAGLASYAGEDVPDVPATFRWGDEARTVGVRLRGGNGSFRTFEDKPAFRIDFGAEGEPFHGIRHLTLKNMVQDASMLAEHAALAVYAARGTPSPRHGYARLAVNGEPYGLYAIVEAVESTEFVGRSFANGGGALWEGQMDDLTEDLVGHYDLVLDGGQVEQDRRLLEVVAALDAATPENLPAVFDTEFVSRTVIASMAVELVTGNDDGYVAWINNYYLYADPTNARVAMIAWGPDQAFLAALDVHGDGRGRLYTDCRASPACSARLDTEILAVADLIESPPWRAWIDAEAARTEADCTSDPRGPGGCASAREAFFRFLDERPEQVRATRARGN